MFPALLFDRVRLVRLTHSVRSEMFIAIERHTQTRRGLEERNFNRVVTSNADSAPPNRAEGTSSRRAINVARLAECKSKPMNFLSTREHCY